MWPHVEISILSYHLLFTSIKAIVQHAAIRKRQFSVHIFIKDGYCDDTLSSPTHCALWSSPSADLFEK